MASESEIEQKKEKTLKMALTQHIVLCNQTVIIEEQIVDLLLVSRIYTLYSVNQDFNLILI